MRLCLSEIDFAEHGALAAFRERLSAQSGQLSGLPDAFAHGPFEVRVLEFCTSIAKLSETETPLADFAGLKDAIDKGRSILQRALWCAVLKRLLHSSNEVVATHAEQAQVQSDLASATEKREYARIDEALSRS